MFCEHDLKKTKILFFFSKHVLWIWCEKTTEWFFKNMFYEYDLKKQPYIKCLCTFTVSVTVMFSTYDKQCDFLYENLLFWNIWLSCSYYMTVTWRLCSCNMMVIWWSCSFKNDMWLSYYSHVTCTSHCTIVYIPNTVMNMTVLL